LSGARYPADQLIGLDPADDRPLLARYDLQEAAKLLRQSLTRSRSFGMWRWSPLLPVADWRFVVSLGEGCTPLVPAPRLGDALGCVNLLAKSEGLNPMGSFKARGMAVAVSRALEIGATSFIVPSAGNAGAALAVYGAAAGVPVTVFMPVDAPPTNHDEVLACGARLVLVDGLISHCGELSAAVAARIGAFDVSTLKEPYRLEGKKTMGFELVEDLGWSVPDVVVYPTGGGTGLVGMWKAFAELEAAGLLSSERPRMISVQAAGCAPIVRAFEQGNRFADTWTGARTRASGIRVPSAVGDFLILDAVRESGGLAIAIEECAIDDAQRLAGSAGAGYVSPETAAGLAAVRLLAERGDIEREDRVVVFDTGVGQKYPPPAGLPEKVTVPADADPDMILWMLSQD
jgi:threonine synthase